MQKKVRGRLYVDKAVQRALIWQLVRHWAVFIVILVGLLFALEALDPARPHSLQALWQSMVQKYAPLFLLIGFLFPVFAYDSIKLSHRFVGPIIRLRGAIRTASNSERTEPVMFRQRDFWREMADDFNLLLKRLPENGPAAAGSFGASPPDRELVAAGGPNERAAGVR